MGLLGVIYAAAGYLLGLRQVSAGTPPRRGGGFLTAAIPLSLAVVVLAWGSPVAATLLLAVIAALYLAASLWLGWPSLLLPAILAVGLGVFASQELFLGYGGMDLGSLPRTSDLPRIALTYLSLAYAALAVFLQLGGLMLRRRGHDRWAWPLTLAGTVGLLGAYLGGLLLDGVFDMYWLAIGLSTLVAGLLFAFAWLERAIWSVPLLSYLGLGAIFIGHFYAIEWVAGSRAGEIWPAFPAGLCALYVALAWLFRDGPLAGIYGTPLRIAGLWGMAVPLVAALVMDDPVLGAIVFSIAGVTYLADAIVRRHAEPRRAVGLVYLSVGAFVIALWGVGMASDVTETQAYTFPLGLALLGVGWNERRRKGGGVTYWLPTLLGLGVLTISAFVQSLPQGAYVYALLLGVEGLLALGWGIWRRSRGYVLVGLLSLIVNALTQVGRAFVDMPRWIQIGVIGVILLGGGLVALFRRAEILRARQRLTETWKEWEP
jgi:hypothetical protein